MKVVSLVVIVLFCSSCREVSESSAAPSPKSVSKSKTSPSKPKFADEPYMDLAARRHLFHMFQNGLVLDLAGSGLRKYSQEYSKPWRGTLRHEGQMGRVLSARSAKLNFYWFDPACVRRIRVTAHGLASGQRMTLRLDSKVVAHKTLSPGWATYDFEIPEGRAKRGEHEISLILSKKGSASGKKSYGLFHSIEVGGEARAPSSTPILELTSDGKKKALRALPRLATLIELPQEAWLDVTLVADTPTTFEISAETMKGTTTVISRDDISKGESKHLQLPLATVGGELVLLNLKAMGAGRWDAPQIRLPKAKSAFTPKPIDNVILLVVDAMRSDNLSLYNEVYPKPSLVRTPRINAMAEQGSAVFLNNQAASPSSPPSHGSIQTGMIPRVHGVDGDSGRLKKGVPTVSTQLVAQNIAAGYFGNNPFGMGRHEVHGKWTAFHQPGQEGKSNDCKTLMKLMIDFAKEQSAKAKRFFISSLPYETHTPYRYHSKISEHYFDGPFAGIVGKNADGTLLSKLSSGSVTLNPAEWRQLKALYRGEAEYMDQCFGQLVDGLNEIGVMDKTALVLTSDHGEGMFEHNKMGHAFGHFRELGDVPFVIFWPQALKKGAQKFEVMTGHLDIAATLLEMMGIKISPKVQGESVLPMIERGGPWTPRVVSLEYGRSYSLRSAHAKLIADYQGHLSYFDLKTDPWEQADLSGKSRLSQRHLLDLVGFFLETRSAWRGSVHGDWNNPREAFHQLLP